MVKRRNGKVQRRGDPRARGISACGHAGLAGQTREGRRAHSWARAGQRSQLRAGSIWWLFRQLAPTMSSRDAAPDEGFHLCSAAPVHRCVTAKQGPVGRGEASMM